MWLKMSILTGVDRASPMAPTKPRAMSATSAASACVNTDMNDDDPGAGDDVSSLVVAMCVWRAS